MGRTSRPIGQQSVLCMMTRGPCPCCNPRDLKEAESLSSVTCSVPTIKAIWWGRECCEVLDTPSAESAPLHGHHSRPQVAHSARNRDASQRPGKVPLMSCRPRMRRMPEQATATQVSLVSSSTFKAPCGPSSHCWLPSPASSGAGTPARKAGPSADTPAHLRSRVQVPLGSSRTV
ncbi:hypothetical protein NDU88_002978 [Pleurodeles waltl]|uniref:Uncharacterized protein n=1 Tax=Pleurodeles waltl TaxID=8319 RepID=A0AAV7VG15_PLEWA|nr:hypothetical protein NDU88_002978 [Pleurodeles waltl]